MKAPAPKSKMEVALVALILAIVVFWVIYYETRKKPQDVFERLGVLEEKIDRLEKALFEERD